MSFLYKILRYFLTFLVAISKEKKFENFESFFLNTDHYLRSCGNVVDRKQSGNVDTVHRNVLEKMVARDLLDILDKYRFI